MDSVPPRPEDQTVADLIDRVLAGEEVILRRDGKVVAKVVAYTEPAPMPRPQFGSHKGVFTIGPEFFDPLPEEEMRGLG